MSDTTQSNRPLWHQNLTYGQVEAEAEKDYAKVVYNLHEDCLCLREELAALKAEKEELIKALQATMKYAMEFGLELDSPQSQIEAWSGLTAANSVGILRKHGGKL
jgi:hypothetical protein